METGKRKYAAKVLLFGEYTVLLGSSALAMPYTKYLGFWSRGCAQPMPALEDFCAYLQQINSSLHSPLAVDAFQTQMESGYVFCSDIPMGQGLGSSAALSASVYDLFADGAKTLQDQKEDLSLIESYFHGKSSGFDSLVSYHQAVIFQKDDYLELLEEGLLQHSAYLWRSETTRSTGPLVQWFITACKEPIFREQMAELAQETTGAVTQILRGEAFISYARRIGRLQVRYLSNLIPEQERPYWEEILAIDQVAIKLCGAGGGGCTLLFSDKVDVVSLYPELQIEQIW